MTTLNARNPSRAQTFIDGARKLGQDVQSLVNRANEISVATPCVPGDVIPQLNTLIDNAVQSGLHPQDLAFIVCQPYMEVIPKLPPSPWRQYLVEKMHKIFFTAFNEVPHVEYLAIMNTAYIDEIPKRIMHIDMILQAHESLPQQGYVTQDREEALGKARMEITGLLPPVPARTVALGRVDELMRRRPLQELMRMRPIQKL